MSYFEVKTHKEIIEDIYDNLREGYDTKIPMINYASFLYEKNKKEKLTINDWLTRINLEIELRKVKDGL